MEREGGGKGAKQRAGDGDGGETITRADGDDEFDMRPTELQDIVQYSGRRAAWRTMAAAGQQLRHPNNNFLLSDPTDHSPARQVPCMKRSRKVLPPRARWHSTAVGSAVACYCHCYPLRA